MKAVLSALVGLGLLAAPVAASPEGIWEIESRDSRYQVSLCGDGTELCAELIWLGNGADNSENLPYLNTLLLDQAVPTGPNAWEGTLRLFGQEAGGTVTQVSDDQLALEGCFLGIICRTYQLFRYAE